MYLTQPTLTARLKALEEELGDPLFVRTSRGMRVTEAGREFLPYAERIVGGFEEGVQLGLTQAMRPPEIESLPLYEDELVLIVDPGHQFTRKGTAGLTEIGEEQLIFFDHDSSYFEQTHALFRNAGIRELRTMEVDNIEAAKRMVEHRLGVAFLPRTAVVRSISAGNLVLISVEE